LIEGIGVKDEVGVETGVAEAVELLLVLAGGPVEGATAE